MDPQPSVPADRVAPQYPPAHLPPYDPFRRSNEGTKWAVVGLAFLMVIGFFAVILWDINSRQSLQQSFQDRLSAASALPEDAKNQIQQGVRANERYAQLEQRYNDLAAKVGSMPSVPTAELQNISLNLENLKRSLGEITVNINHLTESNTAHDETINQIIMRMNAYQRVVANLQTEFRAISSASTASNAPSTYTPAVAASGPGPADPDTVMLTAPRPDAALSSTATSAAPQPLPDSSLFPQPAAH